MFMAALMAVSTIGQQSANPPIPVEANLDDLEDNPDKYLGQTVTVTGEVQKVLGPSLFTIDEPFWIDLDGELLVLVPEPMAAIVRSYAPVRVTGTVKKIVEADIKPKWGFISDSRLEVELAAKPGIVASEVTTVAPAVVSLIARPDQAVGTSGGTGAPLTNLGQVATAADSNLVGRRVDLQGSVVDARDEGFWIQTRAGERLYVLPTKKTAVRVGQTAEVKGVVLEMPRQMRAKIGDTQGKPIYVYADSVTVK
jgi:hypothetical protein